MMHHHMSNDTPVTRLTTTHNEHERSPPQPIDEGYYDKDEETSNGNKGSMFFFSFLFYVLMIIYSYATCTTTQCPAFMPTGYVTVQGPKQRNDP